MLMDGRVLHGTGVNHTDDWRYILTQASVKPWMRQQENWQLTVDLDVLRNASEKLLKRMGFNSSGLIELMRYSGLKNTVGVRLAMDEGNYKRIGQLKSPVSNDEKEALTMHKIKENIDTVRTE